ncbi:MAG: NUDIX hydrolase [Haloarculaceae archaeon]
MTGHPWETLASDVAYTCEGFDIVNETVRLPGGDRTEFDYLSEGPSVVVLPFTEDGQMVVVDEWRQAVRRLNRGFPAGSVEPEEDTGAAARRELREETGYEAGTLSHMTTVEPANGFSDALFHYYIARGCTDTADQSLDDDETISVDTTTLDELVIAARDRELQDGRTAFGVVYYALFEGSAGLPSW